MKLYGLKLTVAAAAWWWLLFLWGVLTLIATRLLGLALDQSLAGAFVALLFHLFSVYWHDFGHAIAARSTGYPMSGIHLFSVIAATLYPANEPPLPGRIHIRRALGGPLASAILALIALLIWWQWGDSPLWGSYRDIASLVMAFFCLENLLVFTAQVILPLGFNDGAVLWRYWSSRNHE